MANHRPFSELRAAIDADPVRRLRIEEMSKAMQSALNLGEIRTRRDCTQSDLANRLGVSQANVSRIEHVDDVYLTMLRGYVEALGGHLRLQAVFDDETVDISIGA
jgi:DNA-binding Xre family transcriptional regulator